MQGAGTFDLPDRLSGALPRWLTSILVGLVFAVALLPIRLAIDAINPGTAPFSLIFPCAILATLFGRWLAGAICATLQLIAAWYYVYPIVNSFRFETTQQALNLAVVASSIFVTMTITEFYRRAIHEAAARNARDLADRDLYLAELDHRVKNNFAIVSGLLDMQRRRASDSATAEALGSAINRVQSIARAHRHLYRDGRDLSLVSMADYIGGLCEALSDVLLLQGGIHLQCDVEGDPQMPRDRAVSVGLVANELITNAAKHAFTDREAGVITVTFSRGKQGWCLTVSDNGVGIAAAVGPEAGGGLGTRLIDAFARQARGVLQTDSDAFGTRVTLDLPD